MWRLDFLLDTVLLDHLQEEEKTGKGFTSSNASHLDPSIFFTVHGL